METLVKSLFNIIGLKIVAVKAFQTDKRKKILEPEFILFSDKKTFIELEEQDYYTYHDCSSSARMIKVLENKNRWNEIMNESGYIDAKLKIY